MKTAAQVREEKALKALARSAEAELESQRRKKQLDDLIKEQTKGLTKWIEEKVQPKIDECSQSQVDINISELESPVQELLIKRLTKSGYRILNRDQHYSEGWYCRDTGQEFEGHWVYTIKIAW